MILTDHTLTSTDGRYQRTVRWMTPPSGEAPRSIAVFLDGEYYIDHMDAVATICHLWETGEMPPVACVFVSHVNPAARHADMPCNPDYARFVAQDVIGYMRETIPGLSESGHLVAGPSLGGLAATFATLLHPEVFSRCLCHSGSFWWNDGWLPTHAADFQIPAARFWMSVGAKEHQSGISHAPSGMRQDIPQITACKAMADALAAHGHAMHYHFHDGGHEIRPWREELPSALAWLYQGEA